jgi:hypothetical protein
MPDHPQEKFDNKPNQLVQDGDKPPLCACLSDPFASLPPELRPRLNSTMGDLRKVICPGCGLVYWTNCKADLCFDCEKKGVSLSGSETKTEA